MSISKLISSVVVGIVFGGCMSIISCDSLFLKKPEEKVESPPHLNTEQKTDSDVKIPTGNEVGLKVEVLGRRKVRLTVSNNSSETVFLPFWAGGKDKYAVYAIYIIEKKDELTGEFKALEGGHLGTGIHPLEPGDFYRDMYIDPEKGIYRIIVYYSIDRKLAEETNKRSSDRQLAKETNNRSILNEEQRMKDEKEFSQKCDLARGTVISETFEL